MHMAHEDIDIDATLERARNERANYISEQGKILYRMIRSLWPRYRRQIPADYNSSAQ